MGAVIVSLSFATGLFAFSFLHFPLTSIFHDLVRFASPL